MRSGGCTACGNLDNMGLKREREECADCGSSTSESGPSAALQRTGGAAASDSCTWKAARGSRCYSCTIEILSAGAGHLLFALLPISGEHGGLAAETPRQRRPTSGSPPPLGRLMGSEARWKMRQDWKSLNKIGEKEAFWMTVLATAVAAGLGLLIFTMVGR